jgi:hypothetical protein
MVSVCQDLRSEPNAICSGQAADWILALVTDDAGGTEGALVEYTITNPPGDDVRFGNGARTIHEDFRVNHVCLPYRARYTMIGTFAGIVEVEAVANNGQDRSRGGVQFN